MQDKSNNSFQALVAANRRGGRLEPKSEKSSTVLIGMRLPEDAAEQAKNLAAQDGRSVSSFAMRMYLRGLADYLAEHSDTATVQ